jgi:death-on-curing protein
MVAIYSGGDDVTFLTLEQVLTIHAEGIRAHGGEPGVLDLGLIASAVYQPQASFGGHYLNRTLPAMASALGYSLIKNHGFCDGNKRVGFSAMDVFLRLNGFALNVSADEGERAILAVAASEMNREQLTDWLREHAVPLPGK